MVRLKSGVLCNETKANFISFILTRCGRGGGRGPWNMGKAKWRDRADLRLGVEENGLARSLTLQDFGLEGGFGHGSD